jgi:eukaryotic-like serine/threonine-protein kinase
MFQSGVETQKARLPPRGLKFAWKLVAILATVAGTVSCGYLRAQPAGTAVTRTGINTPVQNRFNDGTTPTVSPDGRQVVFSAISDKKVQLWLRPLDSPTAHPLEGTENGYYPFWSPDSKSIGFFVWDKLRKLDVSGGPATTIADAPGGRGGTWSQGGVIVFSLQPADSVERLKQVAASGGTVRPATRVNANTPSQSFPWFLPDGRHFLYLSGINASQVIRIGSLDAPGEDRILLDAIDSFAIYSQGYVLFMRGTLIARPFDTKRMEFTGEAAAVGEQVRPSRGHAGVAEFSASTNGVLVYQSGLLHLRLTWKDRAGNTLGTVGDPSNLGSIQFSPDHATAAVAIGEPSGPHVDIWLYDMLRGLRSRFTSDSFPVWSPDGRTIVFGRSGFNLYRMPADGSRNEELLYADELWKDPGSFSPDGKYLAYSATTGGTDVRDSVAPRIPGGIWILPDPLGTRGAAKPYPLAPGGFAGFSPRFSPDGRWIAYESVESGKFEVYVAPFPGPGAKRLVSVSGGEAPRWRADGKELFYIAPDSRLVAGEAGDNEAFYIARNSRLMAAEVDTQGDAFEVKKVVPLFGLEGNECGSCYDVSADGQKFLVHAATEGETSQQLTVVQNWTAEIERDK